MKINTHSLEETNAFAKDWINSLLGRKEQGTNAVVVGLYGNLGSGKTAFTQAVARALGIEEIVTSPTFVIEKIYKISSDGKVNNRRLTPFTHLIHIDAYRLEKSDELTRLGWKDIISNPANLILVEWPEKVADSMPANHIRLKFTFVDETTREVQALEARSNLR